MGRTEAKARLFDALRDQGVRDVNTLAAMRAVPRERFVSPGFQDCAYANTALPIEKQQTISQPLIVGLMTQALELNPHHRVLEIGTGSGYQAAVLSHLAKKVYSVERFKSLLERAKAALKAAGCRNVAFRHGDGRLGWAEEAPFDRIIVTAAAREIPEALVAQLGEDGIMVIPVGRAGDVQELIKLRRTEDGIEREFLTHARFVPLCSDKAG